MAELIVGRVNMGIALLRTASLAVEPVLDDSGKDFLFAKVSLHVAGIVNSFAIATNKQDPAAPVEGNPGDALPTSIFNLRDYLMIPRLYVRFSIGGVVVLETPEFDPTNNQPLTCDARGGPFPQPSNFTHISGTKTGILNYNVVTYVSYTNRALLSNRWTLQASVDNYGMTRRVTRGTAVFRKDYLDYNDNSGTPLYADDFRRWLVIPVDSTSRRVNVDVQENGDGSEIDYTVTDLECVYGLGPASDAVEVTGSITAGIDLPVKDPKSALQTGWNAYQDSRRAYREGGTWAVGTSLLGAAWKNAVPTVRLLGIARAIGRRDADHTNLANVAMNILLARLKPSYDPTRDVASQGYGGVMAGCYVTHNIDTERAPYAEARVEVIAFSRNALTALFNYKAVGVLLNVAPTITINGQTYGPDVQPAMLPDRNNTAGTWSTRLVTQALRFSSQAYDLPANPPDSQGTLDTTGPF